MLGAISQNGGKDIGQFRPMVQENQSGGEVRNRKEVVTGGRGDNNAGHRVMKGTKGDQYFFVAWTRECGDTRCQAGIFAGGLFPGTISEHKDASQTEEKAFCYKLNVFAIVGPSRVSKYCQSGQPTPRHTLPTTNCRILTPD